MRRGLHERLVGMGMAEDLVFQRIASCEAFGGGNMQFRYDEQKNLPLPESKQTPP
jgi:hypothetical protein